MNRRTLFVAVGWIALSLLSASPLLAEPPKHDETNPPAGGTGTTPPTAQFLYSEHRKRDARPGGNRAYGLGGYGGLHVGEVEGTSDLFGPGGEDEPLRPGCRRGGGGVGRGVHGGDDDVALLALFDAGGEVCVRGAAGLAGEHLGRDGLAARWEAVDDGDVEVAEEGEGE